MDGGSGTDVDFILFSFYSSLFSSFPLNHSLFSGNQNAVQLIEPALMSAQRLYYYNNMCVVRRIRVTYGSENVPEILSQHRGPFMCPGNQNVHIHTTVTCPQNANFPNKITRGSLKNSARTYYYCCCIIMYARFVVVRPLLRYSTSSL